MFRSRIAVVLGAAALAALAAPPTLANGRFPATTEVELHPSDPDTRLVPATFGLLITTDGGASYQWVCEDALGYGGTYDPDYALAADGSIFVTAFGGLRASRDGGCTFEPVGGGIGTVLAGSVEIASNGDVWANASAPTDNGVYRSTDDGVSFARTNLDVPFAFWRQLRIAPSQPGRVYISGYYLPGAVPDGGPGETTAILYRTDDSGATWTELPAGDFAFGVEPIVDIEAVSPVDPDVVYARVERVNPPNGDALYRSTDAGQSWVKVLDTVDTITAVVPRADGNTLLVGSKFGTPRVRISTDRGDSWTDAASQPQLSCARERSDGVLFACAANWVPDCMALGRSTTGQTWERVLELQEIEGPLACEPGTVQFDTCTIELWPTLAMQLGVGGAGCGGADAGPGVVDAAAGDAPVATIDAGARDGDGGGCGCSIGLAAVLFAVPRRRT